MNKGLSKGCLKIKWRLKINQGRDQCSLILFSGIKLQKKKNKLKIVNYKYVILVKFWMIVFQMIIKDKNNNNQTWWTSFIFLRPNPIKWEIFSKSTHHNIPNNFSMIVLQLIVHKNQAFMNIVTIMMTYMNKYNNRTRL